MLYRECGLPEDKGFSFSMNKHLTYAKVQYVLLLNAPKSITHVSL